MIFSKKQKINDSEVIKFGFLGGIAEVTYVFLVVVSMSIVENSLPRGPHASQVMVGFMFLLVFVFSAAVSGILVFGYPTYLALQKRYAEALMTGLTTLVTLAIAGILTFILVSFI